MSREHLVVTAAFTLLGGLAAAIGTRALDLDHSVPIATAIVLLLTAAPLWHIIVIRKNERRKREGVIAGLVITLTGHLLMYPVFSLLVSNKISQFQELWWFWTPMSFVGGVFYLGWATLPLGALLGRVLVRSSDRLQS